MVQIIPHNKQPSFMQSLLGGAAEALPDAIDTYSEKLKLNRENEALKKQYGIDLQGINDPNLRHTITANEFQFNRAKRQAQATHGMGASAKTSQQTKGMAQGEQPQGAQEGPNFPQPQTMGQKIPLMTPDQIKEEGRRIAVENTNNGQPTTLAEGIAQAEDQNNRIAQYNNFVEKDVENKKKAQVDYGQEAVDKLLALYPEATGEQQGIFRKMGENEGFEGMSEADINKSLAKKATQFKNTIANVKNSVIEPKRLFSRIKEGSLGTTRDTEKQMNSVRVQVKPLLDLGLYDTARMLLADKGYYPEEREEIISSLGEGSKKAIASMPKINASGKPMPWEVKKDIPYTEPQKEMFHDNLLQAFKDDPSANLVLLRKAYEDKGIRWDQFKDTIDTMILNGDIELNEDQDKQNKYLETPTHNDLEKLLYQMGFIGK